MATGSGTGGNGQGGSSGTGGSGGGGAGTGGTGGDMAMIPSCDVAAQTGCMSGQKCVPSFGGGGGGGGKGTCVANGTVAEGQPCMPATGSGKTINDNCVAGTICDNDGPGSTNVCRKVCTADMQCASGARCGVLITRKWGLCLPSCTPFGSDCPAGNDCSSSFDDISATQMSEVGFFVCKLTGATALWGTCKQDSDCAAGMFCDAQGNGCTPNCDATHACPQPPTDMGMLSCQPLVSQPNGAGYCG
jgi:hypothetical protein